MVVGTGREPASRQGSAVAQPTPQIFPCVSAALGLRGYHRCKISLCTGEMMRRSFSLICGFSGFAFLAACGTESALAPDLEAQALSHLIASPEHAHPSSPANSNHGGDPNWGHDPTRGGGPGGAHDLNQVGDPGRDGDPNHSGPQPWPPHDPNRTQDPNHRGGQEAGGQTSDSHGLPGHGSHQVCVTLITQLNEAEQVLAQEPAYHALMAVPPAQAQTVLVGGLEGLVTARAWTTYVSQYATAIESGCLR